MQESSLSIGESAPPIAKLPAHERYVFKPSEEAFILGMLKRMLVIDMELIKEERKQKGMRKDDPRNRKMSLGFTPFSLPFGVPPGIHDDLKLFFKEKGWEMTEITLSPSIKLEKITRKSPKKIQPKQ